MSGQDGQAVSIGFSLFRYDSLDRPLPSVGYAIHVFVIHACGVLDFAAELTGPDSLASRVEAVVGGVQ